ncbi:MAG: hypothetical protein HKO79_12945 [Desulfobacterales bacterium]|nr:hypothetical protein [Desulfobacterales bacterium]
MKMPDSDIARETSEKLMRQKNELREKWPEIKGGFKASNEGNQSVRDTFLEVINRAIKESGRDYIPVIKNISDKNAALGTKWLQGIVDNISALAIDMIPTFNGNSRP